MIETEEMGTLFKKIRLSKKLSLKDVAGDYLSVSFLSKFERGESEITLSRFLLLLDNLDVSIEEFYGILSKGHATKTEKLIEKVSKSFQENNLLALKKYYKEEIGAYNETGNKTYLYNAIMIESFMVSLTGETITEEKVSHITDYLFGIEQWGKRELIIFGNSMTAISTEALNILIKEIVYKTVLFGNDESNKRIRIGLVINAISVYLDREQLELAKLYLDIISDMSIPETFLYERFEYRFLLGLYWIKSGKIAIGKKKVESALGSIRALGVENLLIAREDIYENILGSLK
ncbi:helix-turn-helix domain-containing protein [Streptococcus pacificus]|uniref:Helix-turn-helix domain-containing protein n=1 Tax=Streptococcus pacificus TaxID=2740577 RepID=A0ABS0ZJH1_9STRE|nr:Rgg/GadR/MutR family transcriptional regulator [Streptococcus pacificus]MBJ8326139.1 helix-turn-helix domain-containing protein [Streptococcus pacificus]